MVHLIAPNGSTVNVSEDKAKRLTGEGYKPAKEKAPRATRKRDSSDESEK